MTAPGDVPEAAVTATTRQLYAWIGNNPDSGHPDDRAEYDRQARTVRRTLEAAAAAGWPPTPPATSAPRHLAAVRGAR